MIDLFDSVKRLLRGKALIRVQFSIEAACLKCRSACCRPRDLKGLTGLPTDRFPVPNLRSQMSGVGRQREFATEPESRPSRQVPISPETASGIHGEWSFPAICGSSLPAALVQSS